MKILVTGATGKVGQAFVQRILSDNAWRHVTVRALCHQRSLVAQERLEVVHGSISERENVERAVKGVTHVLHLATCKETPDAVMDVTVKGMFWLLESCRQSSVFEQLILIGGDAAVGHFFYPHSGPVTEQQRHTAYPGCYALSKVLEEVMLEQYQIQYGFPGCCLRAPWIMEKDDFKFSMSFGDDVFGGPRWEDLVDPETASRCRQSGTIPVMLDPAGKPVKRNFVHVHDLVEAIICALRRPEVCRHHLFNIAMNEPVDYAEVARYLHETRGLPAIEVPTPYYSNWLDNSKARMMLDWEPAYDQRKLADESWDYVRAADDPIKVWYVG